MFNSVAVVFVCGVYFYLAWLVWMLLLLFVVGCLLYCLWFVIGGCYLRVDL